MSPSYVSKIERGELEPSFAVFCGIVRALKLSDKEILFMVKSL